MIATVTLNPSLDEWVTLPALRAGELNRALTFARYAGGKGINVSRVVRELEGHTVAYTLAGGEDGAILRSLLRRLAIRHVCIPIDGSTRNNYKILARHPPCLTEINTPGPAVSREPLRQLARHLLGYRPAPRAVALSGSLPPGVPSTIYRDWILTLRRRGIPTVLDGSGAAFAAGVSARPWLIKPNRQEAEELLGERLRSPSALRRAARALLARGPSLVILSLGAEGALLARANPPGMWMARPPSVRVQSAVGAGDSLIGGFLFGWFRSLSLDPMGRGRKRRLASLAQRELVGSLVEAFRWGIAAGAATAMTPGTELCHRADVLRLLPRVAVRQIA